MTSLRNVFCLIALLTLLAPQVSGQGITGRPVQIVVSCAAGGTGDVLARVIGQAITEKNGQLIIVEDRPGASSIVGTEVAARAAPDGTTILLVENPFILSSILFPGHYDALTAFEPLCYVAATPAVLAVSSKSDIHTFADFIKLARSKPRAASYRRTRAALDRSYPWRASQARCKGRYHLRAIPRVAAGGKCTARRHDRRRNGELLRSQRADRGRRIATDCRSCEKKNRSASSGANIGRKRFQRCRCSCMVWLCRSRQNAKRSFGATIAIHFRCGKDAERR